MNALAALKAALVPKLPSGFKPVTVPELKATPRVLVADDEESFCHLLSKWLEGEGVVVEVAHTVADAKRITETVGVDIVILDLNFSGGAESGIDFLLWAHATHPGLPIIICSGNIGYLSERLNELLVIDAVILMTKPSKPDTLLRLVNTFLTYDIVAR